MIIKNIIFNTHDMKGIKHLLFDIINKLKTERKIKFKISKSNKHVFIHMTKIAYHALKYILVSDTEFIADYYFCNIYVNDHESAEFIPLHGIIIPKFNLKNDGSITLVFKETISFPDKIFKIYSLDKKTVDFAVLELDPTDEIYENNDDSNTIDDKINNDDNVSNNKYTDMKQKTNSNKLSTIKTNNNKLSTINSKINISNDIITEIYINNLKSKALKQYKDD